MDKKFTLDLQNWQNISWTSGQLEYLWLALQSIGSGEVKCMPGVLDLFLVNTCKPHTVFHYLFIYLFFCLIHYIKYKLFWWRWTLCKLRWAVCCFWIDFYQLTTVTENFNKALVKAKPCDLQSWHTVSKATPSLHRLFQPHILFWHKKGGTDNNWMWIHTESIQHTNLSTYSVLVLHCVALY